MADGVPAAETPAKSSGKGRRALLILLLIAIVLGAGWFCWWYFHARFFVSTNDAFIDADIVYVAPQAAGRVTQVAVDNNARVKKGDLLVKLDASAVEAEVAQAQASQEQAQAELAEAQSTVEQKQKAADAAHVTAENSRRIADRDATLVGGGVSKQTAETDEATAKSDAASAAEADAAVNEARAAVGSAAAALDVAKADLASEQVQLSYMTITAPADGTVVQKSVYLGTYVSAGTQMMALVPDQVYITANFKETQLDGLRPGQDVSVKVDAYPGAGFHGKVVSIQKGAGQAFSVIPAENATGNFVKVVQRVPVRISLTPDQPGPYVLGPGMSVEATVELDR